MEESGIESKGDLIFETKGPLWVIIVGFLFGFLFIFLSLYDFPNYNENLGIRIMMAIAGLYHLILMSYVLLFRRSSNPYRVYELGIEFPKRLRKKGRKFVRYDEIERIFRRRGNLTIKIKDGSQFPINSLLYENMILPHLKNAIGEEQWNSFVENGTF